MKACNLAAGFHLISRGEMFGRLGDAGEHIAVFHGARLYHESLMNRPRRHVGIKMKQVSPLNKATVLVEACPLYQSKQVKCHLKYATWDWFLAVQFVGETGHLTMKCHVSIAWQSKENDMGHTYEWMILIDSHHQWAQSALGGPKSSAWGRRRYRFALLLKYQKYGRRGHGHSDSFNANWKCTATSFYYIKWGLPVSLIRYRDDASSAIAIMGRSLGRQMLRRLLQPLGHGHGWYGKCLRPDFRSSRNGVADAYHVLWADVKAMSFLWRKPCLLSTPRPWRRKSCQRRSSTILASPREAYLNLNENCGEITPKGVISQYWPYRRLIVPSLKTQNITPNHFDIMPMK